MVISSLSTVNVIFSVDSTVRTFDDIEGKLTKGIDQFTPLLSETLFYCQLVVALFVTDNSIFSRLQIVDHQLLSKY